jgi:PmbA protein
MLSLDEALNRAQSLVDAARKAGADAADAIYGCDASAGVTVRLGQLEDVEQSESEHIGAARFRGQTLGDRLLVRPRTAHAVHAGRARAGHGARSARGRLCRPRAGRSPDAQELPHLDIDDGEEADMAALRERALEAKTPRATCRA